MSVYCSIFDKKAVSFDKAFFASSIAEATRFVTIACEEGKAVFAKFPADFALYLVAHWDHNTGLMTPTSHGGPQLILEVAALVKEVPLGKA